MPDPDPRHPVATLPRRLDLALDPHPSSVWHARRALRQLVGDDGTTAADTLLLTSELVTNALEHGTAPCTLTALFDPDSGVLRVEVSDGSATPPSLLPAGRAGAIGGHGLHLVDRLARSWGSTPTPSGKTVWFEVDR